MSTGYQESIRTPDNYVLGSSPLPQVILQPTGQWLDFLPEYEDQLKQLESYNCIAFNTHNCIEQIMFKVLGINDNYSDRWTGIKAGTYPPGNDPHTVCETIRKNGLVPEGMCPFSKDLKDVDEYYSYKGCSATELNAKGKEWLSQYSFFHEWVNGNKDAMMEALKYSPLGVAVDAWHGDQDLYIRTAGDNHWTCIVGYVKDKYWIVYDSYINFGEPIKKLDWNFGFSSIKRFHVEKAPLIQNFEQQVSILQRVINLLKEWLKKKIT